MYGVIEDRAVWHPAGDGQITLNFGVPPLRGKAEVLWTQKVRLPDDDTVIDVLLEVDKKALERAEGLDRKLPGGPVLPGRRRR